MIPIHLKDLSFCKVGRHGKKAIEKDWQLPKNQLSYDAASAWLEAGNNYGIICTRDNGVGIIDADHAEYVMAIDNLLPPTFSVETSCERKRHFYYRFKNFPDKPNKISLFDPDDGGNKDKQGGDIRFGSFYCVGPESIHPITKTKYFVKTDHPIAELDFKVIIDVLGKYFMTSLIQDNIKTRSKYKIPILDVLSHYNIELNTRNNVEFFGSHPTHGSDSGSNSNFCVNIEKNVWKCWRHNLGGNIFHLIAMLEGFIDCSQIKDGMPAEVTEKTNRAILDKFGVDMSVCWDTAEKGYLRPTYNNCLNFLEERNYDIKFNEFSSQVNFNGKKYSDRNILKIKEEMRPVKLEPSVTTIDEAIRTFAENNAFHPVKQYLERLEWDGIPRVDNWLATFCEADKDDYSSFISRIMLVAPVKRVYEPGCQYDYMPILEGGQGVGKTNTVKALGGPWYKEISLTERDHNTIQKMQGAWIIEVAELSVFAKRDIESVKAFISNSTDYTRFVYQREDAIIPRQSTFIGTINPSNTGYLMDDTGNRRFLPIKVGRIKFKEIELLRDQLFAEAVQIYKAGAQVHITDRELEKLVATNQRAREAQDDWAEIIVNQVERTRPDIGRYFTACGIYTTFLGGKQEHYDMAVNRRLGKVMRRLGCEISDKPFRVNNVLGRYYDLSPIIPNFSEIGGDEACGKPVDNSVEQEEMSWE